jgi:hypothetical protein
VKKVLEALKPRKDMRDLLYENNLPDWFVRQVNQRYAWNWTEALWDLRSGQFFYPSNNFLADEVETIVPDGPFSGLDPRNLGELLIRKLAAVAFVSLHELPAFSSSSDLAQSLPRSLQIDGFDVDRTNVRLILLEGPVSARLFNQVGYNQWHTGERCCVEAH